MTVEYIYRIINNQNSDVYVGSTTMELEQRLIKHKCDAKQRPDLSKFYTYMNEIGMNNFDIELVEYFPCETKEELFRREGEIIREIGTLNEKNAGRTQGEYKKETYPNRRDKINKRRNERKKENPDKTKEEYKKHGALYRERHRDRLNEKASTKIDCECGGKCTLSHKAEHMNSKNI